MLNAARPVWRRWGARVRATLTAAALVAFFATGLGKTRLWVVGFHAHAHGPLATFDELLEPLGVPSPAATIAAIVAETPSDTTVAFVGEGQQFPFLLAVVNALSYPRPFMGWECTHPAALARSYYGWGPTHRPDGVVFVYRPNGLAPRHAGRWLSPRLLALRRPERFPPAQRLCENVPEPHADAHLGGRGRRPAVPEADGR